LSCGFLSAISTSEYESKEDAQYSNNNVADCEEVILASKCVRCRQYETLFAFKAAHIVAIGDLNSVSACLQRALNAAP